MGIQINTQPQVFTSLSSSAISSSNVYDSNGVNIISRTNTLFTTVSSITGSNLSSPALSSQTLTAGTGVFNTSISAASISAGKFYGDGSSLTNIAGVGAGVTSINGLTGHVTNVVTTSGATLDGTLLAPALSSQTLTAGVATFTTSVSSPAISAGKFTGDGSGLTGVVGVAAGVTSVNGLTGSVLNVVFSNSATNFSQSITATNGTFTTSVSSPSVIGTNILSGGTNLNSIFGTKSTVDSTYTTVNTKSANWDSSYTTVQGNSADWSIGKTLSSSGGRLGGSVTLAGNLTANYITALSGSTFVNTVFTTTSSLCVMGYNIPGPAFYVGANGTGDIASFYDIDSNIEVLHVGGFNSVASNVGIHTSYPNKTLTVSGAISASGDVWFNNVITNNDLTAKKATFTTSVSSPAISAGKFTGDGSGLTGVVGVAAGVTSLNGLTGAVTNVVTTSGATLTGNLLAPALSSQTLTAAIATFTTSVSSPAVSGTHFGSGANLTGVTISNLNGVSGGNIVGTTGLNLSAASLTAVRGTFTTSVSSPALSSNTLTISGYPITPVTTVYSVANGATSTYTLALSDNNNTITLNLGTSGVVQIVGTGYPVGFQTNIIQLSTGRITLSAGSGVTLNNDLSSYRTYKQYSAATLINLGSTWVCYGSLSS
jgi:hypothetical protein